MADKEPHRSSPTIVATGSEFFQACTKPDEGTLSKHQRQRKCPEHHEGRCKFDRGAYQESDPGAYADACGMVDATATRQLPDHRADERAEDDAGDSEEQSDDGANERAPQRRLAGAVAFGAIGAGKKIEHDRERGEYTQKHDHPNGNLPEVSHPRGQEHSAEHHRDARQVGQDRSDKTGGNDDAGDDIPEDGPVHALRIAALRPSPVGRGGRRPSAQRWGEGLEAPRRLRYAEPSSGAARHLLPEGEGKSGVPYFAGVNCSVKTSNGCSVIVSG